MDMSSAVNPPNTIEEDNEENNREQDDYGSDEDSQNDSRSASENSEQENEDNPENDTLEQQEGESGDQDEETSNSEQEDERNQEEEEEEEDEEEEEEEDEEEEEVIEEKEERPTPPPKSLPKRQNNRSIPRSMFYREQQRQHQQQRQQQQQPRQPRQPRQQRQRKRWDSPHRPSQRIHQQRLRDFKDNYMEDPLSLRLHLAQLEGLKEELSNALQDSLAKTDYISELEQRLKTMEIDNSQLHKVNLLTEKKVESFQKSLHESTKQCDAMASELSGAKNEIEKLKQSVKAENNTSTILEKRLTQANAEIEKTKNEFAKLRESSKEQDERYKKKIEEMMRDKKIIEKQNLEMQKVIKKHMQLIGNLRRQVMHVEAATVLRLSEDQFVKALEKNS